MDLPQNRSTKQINIARDTMFQHSQQDSTNETEEDASMGKYGQMNMIQSKEQFKDRKFIAIKNLNKSLENQTIWLRGRLHTSRAKGKVTITIVQWKIN